MNTILWVTNKSVRHIADIAKENSTITFLRMYLLR
jgi:hypothetical protein